MESDRAISTIDEVLAARWRKFYHACNLQDFRSYSKVAAILSKKRLDELSLPRTKFYSETSDIERGLDDRIFGNPSDFGGIFWNADNRIPNVYGPISVVFERNIWKECADIAVTKRTASSEDWDLSRDRLNSSQLLSCYELGGRYWKATPEAAGLEVSISNRELPLSFAKEIIVEPIPGVLEEVQTALEKSGVKTLKASRRILRESPRLRNRQKVFNALVKWARMNAGAYANLSSASKEVPETLALWFEELPATLRRALGSWLTYTYNGTISPLLSDD